MHGLFLMTIVSICINRISRTRIYRKRNTNSNRIYMQYRRISTIIHPLRIDVSWYLFQPLRACLEGSHIQSAVRLSSPRPVLSLIAMRASKGLHEVQGWKWCSNAHTCCSTKRTLPHWYSRTDIPLAHDTMHKLHKWDNVALPVLRRDIKNSNQAYLSCQRKLLSAWKKGLERDDRLKHSLLEQPSMFSAKSPTNPASNASTLSCVTCCPHSWYLSTNNQRWSVEQPKIWSNQFTLT